MAILSKTPRFSSRPLSFSSEAPQIFIGDPKIFTEISSFSPEIPDCHWDSKFYIRDSRFFGGLKLLIWDPKLFVRDPKLYIEDYKLFFGEPLKYGVSNENLGSPMKILWSLVRWMMGSPIVLQCWWFYPRLPEWWNKNSFLQRYLEYFNPFTT